MSAVKQSRARLLTCVALLVSGCSGGNDDSSSNPTPQSPASGSAPTTPASSAGISVAAALAQLEASGVIPVLNRDDTVAGPDADKNGVRDDIDGYIRALPDAQAQKNALSQSARAIQSSLIANPQMQLRSSPLRIRSPTVSPAYTRFMGRRQRRRKAPILKS